MGRFEQERLNVLFETESMKYVLMPFIAPGVSLKAVVDLGVKDQNGDKKRFYEETRYRSQKYNNTNYLVSSSFQLNCYLILYYPNPQYDPNENKFNKSHVLIIRAYAMDDLTLALRNFNKKYMSNFKIVDDKIYLTQATEPIVVHPTFDSTIEFAPDLYTRPNDPDKQEIGVRITINDEFSTIVSGETTWPEFSYKICSCNLPMLGLQMVQSYMACLPGMAISEMGSKNYVSASRYTPYWGEDPDEIANDPSSIKVKGRTSKEDFFKS